jgi:hypothetical protein
VYSVTQLEVFEPLEANTHGVALPLPAVWPIVTVPSGGLWFPEAVSVTVTVQLIESSTATVVGVQLIAVLVVRRFTVIEPEPVLLLHRVVSLEV